MIENPELSVEWNDVCFDAVTNGVLLIIHGFGSLQIIPSLELQGGTGGQDGCGTETDGIGGVMLGHVKILRQD